MTFTPSIRPSSSIMLQPHQASAAEWLLDTRYPHRILGDEPGTGKSYAAIEVAWRRHGPALFIVPAYLQLQWAQYVQNYLNFAPNMVIGGGRERLDAVDSAHNRKITIASYNTVALERRGKKGHALYPKLSEPGRFATIVCDEAHRLRGRQSLATKHIARARASSSTDLKLLTGTPFFSGPADAYSLLNLCAPKTFGGYWTFCDRFCEIEETPWSRKAKGLLPHMRDEFAALIAPYVLRRTMADIGMDLPPAVNVPVPVDLPAADRKRHDTLRKSYVVEADTPDGQARGLLGAGAVIVALRHLTGFQTKGAEKLKATLDLIEDLEGEHIILLTWYRESRNRLASALQGSCPIFKCDEDDTHESRAASIARWTAASAAQTPIILGTIAGLGEGNNLQAASKVILYEQDWVEAQNEQAIARARRFGQQSPVTVYRMFARNTLDEDILQCALERRNITREALLTVRNK